MSYHRLRLLPIEPVDRLLAQLIADHVDMEHRGRGGCWPAGLANVITDPRRRRYYYRARQAGGYSIHQADLIACHLGHHPAELWPEWFALGDGLAERIPA